MGLLAVAGCAPSGPSAQNNDNYAQTPPPAPPLMGAAPRSADDGTGLMGGPPRASGEASQSALRSAQTRADAVVGLRRADGMLAATMRPVANPEDMDPAERERVYGAASAQPEAQTRAQAHSADTRIALAARPAPSPKITLAAPQIALRVTPAPAPAAPGPIARPPQPKLAPANAAPAANAKAPSASVEPAAQAGDRKTGGFFSFLERLKFWDRQVAPPNAGEAAEQAKQAAQRAGEVARTAAADPGAEQEILSTRNILLALAVLAAVLILAAISRNATARKQAQRRRVFQTYSYGARDSQNEHGNDRGPGLAAPLVAAAAGAVAATAYAHHRERLADEAEAKAEAEARASEREPAPVQG